ncbi:MAG: filamentous hemagglutinin N-terminal domain-containing protein, partial [Proteobacteria bacterium]|nr:filamentous hemagglutinin N-terminal domain-containing protein [Pseudomonadota bacterium]
MSRAGLLVSAAALALAAGPVAAQAVATSITPDLNAFAVGTTVSTSGTTTTIAGGTRAGGNLFHSFSTFDLAQGETAVWTAANPSGVANVINRVTGGKFSTIAGTLDTTALPNAAFYFINPAGVLFTGGARLNVPGAAYISTAEDGLKFADGTRFSTVTPNGSAFSMSAPQSFGFLGFQNPIIIDGVASLLPEAKVDLSLFASDVGVRNSQFLPRTITISTIGARVGALSLADPFNGAPLDGATVLVNANIFATATGKGAPSVRIATGAFTQQGGELTASTRFDGDAGDLLLAAQTADIEGGVVASDTGGSVLKGDAGTVRLTVGALRVAGGGVISSDTFGAGAAGGVIINAGSVTVDGDLTSVGSDSAGGAAGSAGTVTIDVTTLNVTNGAQISSSTNGPGDAGTVQVKAGTIVLNNGSIDSATLGGTGRGGLVSVQADQITMAGVFGGLGSASAGPGDAGAVQVRAGAITMTDLSSISSAGQGTGAAGDVNISAATINLTNAFILSDAEGEGRAGTVSVTGTNIVLNNSAFTSTTDHGGPGGDVIVNAGSITLSNDSQFASRAFGAGNAGTVNVTADKLSLDFSTILSDAFDGATGAAGGIVLNVGQLQVGNQSEISSDTSGPGNAGTIAINAKGLSLTGDSSIESAAISGTGSAGRIAITTGSLDADFSVITSTTQSAGQAGDVTVTANSIKLSNQASIESTAFEGSTGAGGKIQITADDVSLTGSSGFLTSTLSSGDAGELRVSAGRFVLDHSIVASNAIEGATGAANTVMISGGSLDVIDHGQVLTSSNSPKTAGAITIATTGGVTVSGQGSVISSANISGAPGAAGLISISAAPVVLSDGGAITTNSVAGAAGDITLKAPHGSYVLLQGKTDPGVITTSSGPGTGGKITITDPVAIISNGGQILALGQQRGANVQLTSDFFIRSADRDNELAVDGVLVLDSQVSDVSAGVTIPDIAFLDASGVLRGQCPAARSGGLTSQLRIRPFGPYVGGGAAGGPRLAEAAPAGCLFAPAPPGRGALSQAVAAAAASYGQPAFAQVATATPPLAAPDFAPTVTLADVLVTAPPGGGKARPQPGWQAGPDPATGLVLEAPGPDGFDAAWVRRQFTANGLVGRPAPLDRLLGLAQLINLAFVRNGYVNSGVLFAGPIPRDGGTLQVRLVYGASTPGAGAKVRFGPHGRRGLTEGYVRSRMAAAL